MYILYIEKIKLTPLINFSRLLFLLKCKLKVQNKSMKQQNKKLWTLVQSLQ